MSKTVRNPFIYAGMPMVATGVGFVATGIAGQPAFGYAGVGLLLAGAILSIVGIWWSRRQA